MTGPEPLNRSLGPPDPLDFPPRSDVVPNDNPPVGSVGPNTPTPPSNVLYPADDRPLEAIAWDGWPANWQTPNVDSLAGMSATDLDIVFACIDLNGRAIGDMPVYVERRSTPIEPPSWASNPNPLVYTHWGEFMRQAWASYQACGEIFIVATSRFESGYPRTFMVLNAAYVTVELVDGVRRYTIAGIPVDDGDLLHIRYNSRSDLPRGIGPLDAAGERILAARTLMRYGSDLARNGGIPWAVLKHKYRLGKVQAESVKAQWIASARNRAGAPAILDSDMDLQVLQVPPKDMALSEQQTFAEARIATLLGVPPYLVSLETGASMTYANVNSLFVQHWRTGLAPGAGYISAALSHWALPNGTNLRINPAGYISQTPTERVAYYTGMIAIGAMTVEEVRAAEGLGELDDDSTPKGTVPDVLSL